MTPRLENRTVRHRAADEGSSRTRALNSNARPRRGVQRLFPNAGPEFQLASENDPRHDASQAGEDRVMPSNIDAAREAFKSMCLGSLEELDRHYAVEFNYTDIDGVDGLELKGKIAVGGLCSDAYTHIPPQEIMGKYLRRETDEAQRDEMCDFLTISTSERSQFFSPPQLQRLEAANHYLEENMYN